MILFRRTVRVRQTLNAYWQSSHHPHGRTIQWSLHVATRRPETVKIGGERSATCRGCAVSHLVYCRSSATSAGCATFSEEHDHETNPCGYAVVRPHRLCSRSAKG